MTPEKQQPLQACIQEVAAILYEETSKSKRTNLDDIEKIVRWQILEHISPNVALFLSNKSPAQSKANLEL